jgi:hypothetical protein
MKMTVSALVAVGLSWWLLSACGEKHDILGTRADAGGPSAGTAGSSSGATGGTPAAGAAGATSGGKSSAGAGGVAGQATGGNGGAGAEVAAGGASGTSGSGGNDGSGGVGMTAGVAGENSGEAGAGTAGTAGMGSGGTGGASPTCATDCRPTGPCTSGEVSWTCGNGWDHQEFVDGGCTDQGTALPRYCCPPEFHAGCMPCADATTLEDCESRSYCHPVFTDMGDCSCAPVGCCTFFTRCAEGALANCIPGPITCGASPTVPLCAEPAYVVSYTPGCTEGCVKPEDCSMPQ